MHTELYCASLPALDPVKAVRSLHEAYMQLTALTANVDCGPYDTTPALHSLADCLQDAGHIGFPRA